MFSCTALLLSLVAVLAFEKTYDVRGAVTCFVEPAAEALVEMKYFDKVHKGQVLATVTTDDEGHFAVKASGDTADFASGDFEVYLEISSFCDHQKREGCDVLTAVNIPASTVGEEFEMKTIRLDRRTPVANTCDEDDDVY